MFLKFPLLTPQERFDFEDALKLPRGFLLAFEDNDETSGEVLEKMCN